MESIGVIGNGFVGGAVASLFKSRGYTTYVYDVDPARSTHDISEVCKADFVFVCVPTATDDDGVQDQGPLEEAFRQISLHRGEDSVVVLKSTVLPGTSKRLITQYEFPLVFNPEFLTARTAVYDFAHPKSIILGGQERDWERVRNLYAKVYENWGEIPLLAGSMEMAELVKYARNTFFALKVAWWNEFYDLCESYGVPYNQVRDGVVASGWTNIMHMQVPGPDGQRGFGGACFPKDTQALARHAKERGVSLGILEAAIESNRRIRGSEKDPEE